MNLKKLFSVAVFLSVLFLTSCVSTEITEPVSESLKEENSRLVLTMSAPAEVSTRAMEGYKLRYIAKIFSGYTKQNWQLIQRQEIIDGENDNNEVVFSVPADANYSIIVFADYIPQEYTKSSDGTYKDYFYNTKSNQKNVILRTTPGSDSQTVSPQFFNNDGYDCFYGMEKLRKEAPEVVVNMTLKRVAAQVKFEDISENEGEATVKVNKLGVRKQLDFDESPVTTSPSSSEADKSLGNILIAEDVDINPDMKDVFYFYTLADLITAKQYVSVEFSVTKGEIVSDPFTVTEIPVKSNFRTIVKGSYLPDDEEEEEPKEEEPGEQPGDIILHVSTPQLDWEEMTK